MSTIMSTEKIAEEVKSVTSPERESETKVSKIIYKSTKKKKKSEVDPIA